MLGRRFVCCAVIALLALNSAVGAEANRDPVEYYRGNIDGKLEFLMQLAFSAGKCSGSYYYKVHKKPILLYGSCDAKGIALEERSGEFGKKPHRFNKFEGARTDSDITGIWRSADGKKAYKFYARKIIPDKAEILGDAKGRYGLSSISGFYGANTMADIFYENGRWRASGSSISAGMRQGYDVRLSKKEQKILSSFKIVVDDALAVNVMVGNTVIAKFPYSDRSVFRVTSISRAEDTINRIFKDAERENFSEGRLHIATSDEFNFSDYVAFENTPIDPVHAVSVDYYPGGFHISVIDKHCCGNTTLEFEKR